MKPATRYAVTIWDQSAPAGQPYTLTNNRMAAGRWYGSNYSHGRGLGGRGVYDLGSTGLNSQAYGIKRKRVVVGQTEIDSPDRQARTSAVTAAWVSRSPTRRVYLCSAERRGSNFAHMGGQTVSRTDQRSRAKLWERPRVSSLIQVARLRKVQFQAGTLARIQG